MTIIEQIKAEIERLIVKHELEYTTAGYVMNELLSFLSTLESKKPLGEEYTIEIGKYTHTLRIGSQSDIDNLIRQEKQEQPSEGLKDEAVNYCFDNGLNLSPRVATDFARYFYDLGCRRTAEKYDEIEYNRQRAEEHLATSGKTLEIKPGDEVTINGHKIVYDKDKGYVTIAKSEESVPKDLEEAARKSSAQYYKDAGYSPFPNVETAAHMSGFIAGAKWQAEHSPFPEDTVLFSKGVEEGKRLMMGEAVEGEVVKDWDNNLSVKSGVICGFKFGEKVRVIVLPKED